MCHGLCGEEYFLSLVKKFKKRIIRSRTNARSYRRNIKQVEFLARNSKFFGLEITINEKKRSISVKEVEREEEEEDDDDRERHARFEKICAENNLVIPEIPRGIAWPVQYLNGGFLGGAA